MTRDGRKKRLQVQAPIHERADTHTPPQTTIGEISNPARATSNPNTNPQKPNSYKGPLTFTSGSEFGANLAMGPVNTSGCRRAYGSNGVEGAAESTFTPDCCNVERIARNAPAVRHFEARMLTGSIEGMNAGCAINEQRSRSVQDLAGSTTARHVLSGNPSFHSVSSALPSRLLVARTDGRITGHGLVLVVELEQRSLERHFRALDRGLRDIPFLVHPLGPLHSVGRPSIVIQ